MDPTAIAKVDALHLQLQQLLVEQQAENALLRASLIVLSAALLVVGWLAFYQARRSSSLAEAYRLQECRHWQTMQKQLETHSHERAFGMTQMLHGFEGIINRVRKN